MQSISTIGLDIAGPFKCMASSHYWSRLQALTPSWLTSDVTMRDSELGFRGLSGQGDCRQSCPKPTPTWAVANHDSGSVGPFHREGLAR